MLTFCHGKAFTLTVVAIDLFLAPALESVLSNFRSVKQEPSVSPPPKYSMLNHAKESPTESAASTSQRKRTARKSSADANDSEQDKRGKKKIKSKKEGPASNPDGSRRVYVCPHCQRSYDWNYNLNRHLKYECGKENAFQCAKCGRKFPHKQVPPSGYGVARVWLRLIEYF